RGMRMFRLDRILRLESTDQSFIPPQNFDCLMFVMQSVATMPADWPVEIVLRLSIAEAKQRIPPGYAVLQPIEDGVRLGGAFNDLDAVARFLVSLGCRFVVIEPQELRAALRRLGQETIDQANDNCPDLAPAPSG
ncbi:MAG TPA: WYL domain-containing protein, partial [Nitrolancea sp.]|nr:WYL domain-containing protein [Nitrolancea sp.]